MLLKSITDNFIWSVTYLAQILIEFYKPPDGWRRSYSPTRPAGGAGVGAKVDAFESLVSFAPAKPSPSMMTLEQRKLASQAGVPAPNAFQLAQIQNRPLSPSNPALRQQQYNPSQSAFSSVGGAGMLPQASPVSTPPRSLSPGFAIGGTTNDKRGSPYPSNASGGSLQSPVPMASSSPQHNHTPVPSNTSAINANSGGPGGGGTFWDLDYLSKPSVSPQLSTIQPTTTSSNPFEISFFQTSKPSPTQAQPDIDSFSVFAGPSLKPTSATATAELSTIDFSEQHRRQVSPPAGAALAPRSTTTWPVRSRQPSNEPSSKDFELAQVMEMGFDLDAAEIALEAAGGDVALAIDLLIKNREADGVERERAARRGRDNGGDPYGYMDR
ncbi:hypothetical protein HK101_008424, partial [Irineochytrium annulatum]